MKALGLFFGMITGCALFFGVLYDMLWLISIPLGLAVISFIIFCWIIKEVEKCDDSEPYHAWNG